MLKDMKALLRDHPLPWSVKVTSRTWTVDREVSIGFSPQFGASIWTARVFGQDAETGWPGMRTPGAKPIFEVEARGKEKPAEIGALETVVAFINASAVRGR